MFKYILSYIANSFSPSLNSCAVLCTTRICCASPRGFFLRISFQAIKKLLVVVWLKLKFSKFDKAIAYRALMSFKRVSQPLIQLSTNKTARLF